MLFTTMSAVYPTIKPSVDVVILAVPDPSSLHINRFLYTEFFKILKQKITRTGCFMCRFILRNYLGPEKKQQEASIYNSIKGHFKYFVIIPGEKDYFIGSDSPLSANIAELSDQRNITASYVNSDYMDDRSIVNRGTQIQEQLNKLSILNTDNQPIPVFYESLLLAYLSQFVGRKFYWLLIPFILLLSPFYS
jgi:spermidine synthase